MILNLETSILLLSLLLTYIIASFQDIKYRKTAKYLDIVFIAVSVAGIVVNYLQYGLSPTLLTSYLIGIGLCFVCHFVNVILVHKHKNRIFGGSDIRIFMVSIFVYPIFINEIYSCLIIVPLVFLISTFTRFIPLLARKYKEKGLPFIPFLGISTFIPVLIEITLPLFFR